MTTLLKLALGLLLIGGLFLSAEPVTYFSGGNICAAGSGHGYCSSESGAVTITFDGAIPQAPTYTEGIAKFSWGTPNPIVTGSVASEYAAPPDPTDPQNKRDVTPYLTIGSPTMADSVTIDLEMPIYYFGFWMGSPDHYNQVEFFRNGAAVGSPILGDQLIPPGQGNQSLGDFVNFRIDGGADQVVLSSSQAAFEIDNVALSSVPEPSSFALFGTACLGLFGLLRSKFKRS